MRFLQTWNAWKFAMFKNFINSQLLKPIFLSPNHCETQIQKIIKLQNTLFYRSATSPFVVQLFLLPFSSHSSKQNIGFNDSGYVIKPPQPRSAIYGAPPFTGNPYLHRRYCIAQKTMTAELLFHQLIAKQKKHAVV